MKNKIVKSLDKGIKKGRGRLPPVIDYNNYEFSKKELFIYAAVEAVFAGITAYLFYDSIIAFLILMPVRLLSLKDVRNRLCKKRKRRLEIEFKDAILSVSSNLQAGYSVENAFGEAYKDIVLLYGKESLMARELNIILRQLGNNEQLEDILLSLSKRSGVQDIRDFADTFHTAKRSGGDIRAIIADTAGVIGDKQEVRLEIDTVMSEKKFEQTIMRYMPFFIIFYISITSKGYFESLYHNLFGWFVMTAALAVYIFACRLSDKILDIEI